MNRFSCLARASRAPAGSQRIFSNRGRTARPRRGGFTLIEMLVSLAITLLMMGAVVTLFGVISDSVSASRALIEISDQLRGAREMLQQDLQGATATMTPPLRPENNQGYFEIIEGEMNDGRATAEGLNGLFGDLDDVLMFTSNRPNAPFLGRSQIAGGIIESPNAEVVYFLRQDGQIIDATTTPPVQLCTLYRRVLLVAPSTGTVDANSNPPLSNGYFTANDISARLVEVTPGQFGMVPNTLGDLTKLENRFAHYSRNVFREFPSLVNTDGIPWIDRITPPVKFGILQTPVQPTTGFGSHPSENAFLMPFDPATPRAGDDILLRNVLAFDVQVFDPGAPIFTDTLAGTADRIVVDSNAPGGYAGLIGSTPSGFGAFVDLGFLATLTYTPATGNPTPLFGDVQNPRSGSASRPFRYDTWSDHYENDGMDILGNPIDATHPGDLATNGLDDNGDGVVDDIDERDTMPPYSAPLRGIKVTIRVYETSSKQVREAVVMQNFDTK